MKLSERFKSLTEEFKRFKVRKDGRPTDVKSNEFGLSQKTVIGWFSNKHNSFGWSIHRLGRDDKEFQGKNVFRTFQDEKGTTSIIKFDFNKGTYAFLDNKAFENGDIKFEKMSPYSGFVADSEDIKKGLK
jgi:hypothetical protein